MVVKGLNFDKLSGEGVPNSLLASHWVNNIICSHFMPQAPIGIDRFLPGLPPPPPQYCVGQCLFYLGAENTVTVKH